MTKLPPIEKIYEAYSAIADQRVALLDRAAIVLSSDGAREYTVTWEGDVYSSSDSATYWQGYAGYPVLAVLMLQGRLPLDARISAFFSGVNWTQLNQTHKRDYAAAVAEVLDDLRAQHVHTEPITREVAAVYEALRELDVTVKRGAKRPPKAT